MRIITKSGTDIPYEAVSLVTKTIYGAESAETKTYMLGACFMYRPTENRNPIYVAKYDTSEEARQTILQIAILAAKGTKLIRMTENGEIEVVV